MQSHEYTSELCDDTLGPQSDEVTKLQETLDAGRTTPTKVINGCYTVRVSGKNVVTLDVPHSRADIATAAVNASCDEIGRAHV